MIARCSNVVGVFGAGRDVAPIDFLNGPSGGRSPCLALGDRPPPIDHEDTEYNVEYDVMGRVTSQPTRNGSRQPDYFSSGAIRSLTQGDSTAQFAYDAFGRLAGLDVQSGSSVDQRHDRHYGALISRRDVTSGSATTSQLVRRIPGPGGIVATHRGPGSQWVYGFGELRGLRFVTDDTGAFIQDVAYQPFGEAKSAGAQAGAPSTRANSGMAGMRLARLDSCASARGSTIRPSATS